METEKKKNLKKKEAVSQLAKEVEEVSGSNIVTNHVNQLRSCSKSATGTGSEGSLEFSIRRTCPNHRMRVPSTIRSNLLDRF